MFLRVLEYYSGILFLTTNRVGAFDDAFRSRVHLSLYYPPLDRRQTIQVWKTNLRRTAALNEKRREENRPEIVIKEKKILEFAKKNCDTLRWNGRQIRNAFQTAIALAEFDAKNSGENQQPVMSAKHFAIVAKTSKQFDHYLKATHGGLDESHTARREQVRWDYEVKQVPELDMPVESDEQSSSASSSSSNSEAPEMTSDNSSASEDSDLDSDDLKDKKRKGKEAKTSKEKAKEKAKRKEKGKKMKEKAQAEKTKDRKKT